MSMAEKLAAAQASAARASTERAESRTHCRRGHPLTDENVRVRRNDGFRECKVCERLRNSHYTARAQAYGVGTRPLGLPRAEILPPGPFLEWLDSRPERKEELCRLTSTQPRVLYRLRHEEGANVSLDVVDRFVTPIDGPHVLNELYPLCDVCLDGIAEDVDDARCGLGVEEVNGTWRCKDHLI